MAVIDQTFFRAYQSEKKTEVADYCVQIGTDMGVSVPMPHYTFPSVVPSRTEGIVSSLNYQIESEYAMAYAIDSEVNEVAMENAYAAGTLRIDSGPMELSNLNVGGLVDGEAERRPLSTFMALEPTMAPEPKSQELFQPALEVDHFLWPAICERLGSQCQGPGYLMPIVEQLKAEIQQGRSLIGVFGAEPKAGCTTILLSLARLLTEGGIRVALVDGDDHWAERGGSSGLACQLGLNIEYGWADVLSGRFPLAEVAIQSLTDKMVIVPLADRSNAPNDAGSSLRQIPDYVSGASIIAGVLRYNFDVVLIDLGCVAHPQQATIADELIRQCRLDTTIVVSHEAEHTRLRAQAVEIASGDDSVCLGVIENFMVD